VLFAISITKFDVMVDQRQQLQPAELFKHPFVVELVGAGFDKLANARYFALRFPQVLKIHQDRTFKDTVSFNELVEVLGDSESEEEIQWFDKLRKVDTKSNHLVQKSIISSSSDIPSPTAVAVTFFSSKRKMSSELSPQFDSAAKRVKQGEMGIAALRRGTLPEVRAIV
jgi:DNA ligase 4